MVKWWNQAYRNLVSFLLPPHLLTQCHKIHNFYGTFSLLNHGCPCRECTCLMTTHSQKMTSLNFWPWILWWCSWDGTVTREVSSSWCSGCLGHTMHRLWWSQSQLLSALNRLKMRDQKKDDQLRRQHYLHCFEWVWEWAALMGKLDRIWQFSHWDTTSRNLSCFFV